MKGTRLEEFYVLVSVLGDAIARCSLIAPSVSVYLEMSDASRDPARALFSRGDTGDVLVYVEGTKS